MVSTYFWVSACYDAGMSVTSTQRLHEVLDAPERGNVYAPMCPSRAVLDHVTSRWGVLVLVALLGGSHRFSELGRKVAGVSDKMLAQTLKALERDGFVVRTAYVEVPIRVEYALTELGKEVAARLEDLTEWIEANIAAIELARDRFAAAAAAR